MRFNEFTKKDKETSKKIARINKRMQQDPNLVDEIFNTVALKVKDNEGKIGDRIISMIQPEKTGPEQDQTAQDSYIKSLAAVISETEGSVEDKLKFANTLGSVNHIDIKALQQPIAGWSDWLVGTEFSKKLFDNIYSDRRFQLANKGPGEAALAFLSPQIKLRGGEGDIEVGGDPVEVKAGKTKSGGRFSPTSSVIGQPYNNLSFWRDIVEDEEKAKILSKKTTTAVNYNKFLIENDLDEEDSFEILRFIFQAASLRDVRSVANRGSDTEPKQLFKLALKNYAVAQNEENFLILQRDIQTSLYFSIDNVDEVISKIRFTLPLITSDTRTQGKAQIGIGS